MTGSLIRVTSRDGFEFDAYHVKADGPRKGGVVVVQEIFGLSDHIKEMTERFGAAGSEAIAPSLFDRAEPGFIVQPPDVAANMARGRDLAVGNGQDNTMNDIGGVFDVLSPAGKVCITGYCYGGSMSWLAASRIAGMAAASCYYGGNIPQMLGLTPKCPTICHFGSKDAHIPLVGAVDKIEAVHPAIPVHVYDAGHGFARRNSSDYDAASDQLAFERTLALFDGA